MNNMLAIVGRPNVGKSTLFNRLTESRRAIVEETSGVTRDRHYGYSEWNGIEFSVIDTGGYVSESRDFFEKEIKKQAEIAIDEADTIAFVVDAMEGLSYMDKEIANMLRQTKKKVFLIANKSDNTSLVYATQEFHALGFEKIYTVSAINGSGTGDFLDDLVKEFKKSYEEDKSELPHFAVIGRPNVGKSSLINALVGKVRNIVTPMPGTTRDSTNTYYKQFGFEFILVDTAGLRKKGKIKEDVEFYSVLRSIRAIEKSDVCLLLTDATKGFEAQDINIFRLVERNRKGAVILVNKWDMIEKTDVIHKSIENQILNKLAPFIDISVIFTSVIKKQRIFKALKEAMHVYENRKRKIPTSRLNKTMLPIINAYPPPRGSRGKQIKIKYATQLPTQYPSFAFFCNYPTEIRDQYKRFIENKIRQNFDFRGVPVQIYFRKK